MRPPCLTSSSPLPLEEGNEDRDNHLLLVQTSQASLPLWPIFSDPTDQGQQKGYYDQDNTQKEHHKCQEDLERRQLSTSIFNSLGCQWDEDHEYGYNNLQVNRTTSRMKRNQKFEKSQAFDDENDHAMSTVVTAANTRVCSDCNTTKTPLWRSGPHGPKSLCNACGIRRRKERRAMAAAKESLIPSAAAPANICGFSKHKWHERSHTASAHYKKRSRSRKKIRFEDFSLSLRNNSALHQLLPQDEKDAAILLMALSCGLVCS